MSPLDGSTLIYKTFVLPFFYKNQGAIDNVLNRGKAAFSNLADEGSSLKHNFDYYLEPSSSIFVKCSYRYLVITTYY